MWKAFVRLGRAAFLDGDEVWPSVSVKSGEKIPNNPALVFAGSKSGDVEVVPLVLNDAGLLVAKEPIKIVSSSRHPPVPGDRVLSLADGEIFIAFFSFARVGESAPKEGDLVAAFGVMGKSDGVPNVKVIPDLFPKVKQNDRPDPYLVFEGGLPVRVAADELIVHPVDDHHLRDFLDVTGAKLVDRELAAKTQGGDHKPLKLRELPVLRDLPNGTQNTRPQRQPSALTKLPKKRYEQARLAALRTLFADDKLLLTNDEEFLNVYAQALDLHAQGFRVAFNPRLEWSGEPSAVEGLGVANPMSTGAKAHISDPIFGLQKAWAYLSLWDADTRRIPVAFVDIGFAPNADFPRILIERNVATGIAGPGQATAPPTVGNSFFGSRSWHGNGVVTTAAGVFNNGYGTTGTGGQVIDAMLYKTDLLGYAFGMGTAIRMAVDDGATIINISAGYPCTIQTNLIGGFRVCSPGARVAFCAALDAALHAAAAAAFAIPFAGLVLGPALLLTASLVLPACLLLVALGDPRSPMETAVAYAMERGVTVVSIPGNQQTAQSLGPLAEFVPTGPQDASAWEVVPGVIPGVICVGAADPNASTAYTNQHYFGARVDVWAPTGGDYSHPPTTDAVVPSAQQVFDTSGFGGTSASAPYVTGIIAMMQAINPSLDPRTPGLTAAQKAAIPGRIRSILVGTATPASALPTNPADPNVARRRNLVNAFAAVRAAAAGVIPDYDALGYDTSLGFDERNSAVRMDTVSTARTVRLDLPAQFAGTILNLKAAPGSSGATFADVDMYSLVAPSSPGVYQGGVIQLIQPAGARGELRINDLPGTLMGITPDGLEEVRAYTIPALFESQSFLCRVSGFMGSDSVYKLRLEPAVRMAAPAGDRFDDNSGRHPRGLPNNNSRDAAVPIGREPIPWQVSGVSVAPVATVTLTDLTLHTSTDEDWFEIVSFPDIPPTCDYVISITAGEGTRVEIRASDGTVIASGLGDLTATIEPAHLPLFIRVRSATGGPISYSLGVTYNALPPAVCEFRRRMREHRFDRKPWPFEPKGNGFIIIDPLDDPVPFIDRYKHRLSRGQGLMVFQERTGGFRLSATVPSNKPLRVTLIDAEERVRATVMSSTSRAKLKSVGKLLARPILERRPVKSDIKADWTFLEHGNRPETLGIEVANLDAGVYALVFDDTEQNTPIELVRSGSTESRKPRLLLP
ncbi:MAG: S8/S53 family peptidase [Polyangiaceae bacterium]|nr:S8/S53 family peptidase [Polyangiaceae bacterium]